MATATPEKNVDAKPRQSSGKNDAKRLRRSGMIPAVVYGAGQDAQTIAVDPKQMGRILNSERATTPSSTSPLKARPPR